MTSKSMRDLAEALDNNFITEADRKAWASELRAAAKGLERERSVVTAEKSEFWPYTEGPVPCRKCMKIEVRYYEIDSDHGDCRWKCFACGSTGVWEGPDA